MRIKTHVGILWGSLCLVLLSGPPSSLAAITNVKIVDFGFEPADVTVKVGDTVTWTNTGSFAHTTTSGTTTGGVRHPDGLWDSGSLFSGQTFSHVFAKAGAFPYYCTPHFSMMVGTVTVQPPPNSSSSVLPMAPRLSRPPQ